MEGFKRNELFKDGSQNAQTRRGGMCNRVSTEPKRVSPGPLCTKITLSCMLRQCSGGAQECSPSA
jgi:hypothetical protein